MYFLFLSFSANAFHGFDEDTNSRFCFVLLYFQHVFSLYVYPNFYYSSDPFSTNEMHYIYAPLPTPQATRLRDGEGLQWLSGGHSSGVLGGCQRRRLHTQGIYRQGADRSRSRPFLQAWIMDYAYRLYKKFESPPCPPTYIYIYIHPWIYVHKSL